MSRNDINGNYIFFSNALKLVFYMTSKSVPITTNVVSLNPVHGKVYSMQHFVIKFVSDLRQVDGFLGVLRFLPPIKLTAAI
jgi:hypothetical protein